MTPATVFITHIRRFDWLLLGSVLFLMALGLIALFSISRIAPLPFFTRQIVWIGVGVLGLFAASFVDFRVFRTQGAVVLLCYLVSVFLLGLVLVASHGIRGIDAWLTIGGVSLQPVELAKLSLVILLAKFFSKRHVEIYRIQHLAVSGLYLAVPCLLVLAQPDLGSAVVLVAIWFAVILFSGIKLRHFFVLLVLGAFIAGGFWHWGLAGYQKARITSFLDPYEDPQGAGYQMIQAMIAVGSGRIWGKGLGYGSQSHLNFLPEPQADFIFAAFAEEWGFVGAVLLLILLGIILWRMVAIGSRSADNFSRLYALGFAALIFAQSFIHIGANMGVLPITGITLPFMSYGGSSLITLLLGVGILQNIHINARKDVE